MKRFAGVFCMAAASVAAWAAESPADALRDGFADPPPSARPHVWYHMMNGNVTKEGVTCDFEALAKAGIGGVQMFDAGCAIPRGDVDFDTPEWHDLMRHAASEARRLGLEMVTPNCSGWSASGGPWNAPSNAMKKLVFSETRVKGPAAFRAKLPREKRDNGFYGDIAVLAFPVPEAEKADFPGVKCKTDKQTALLESDSPFALRGVSFTLSFPGAWTASADVVAESSMDGKTFSKCGEGRFVASLSGAKDLTERHLAFEKPVAAKTVRLRLRTKQGLTFTSVRPECGRRLANIAAKRFEIRAEAARDTVEASEDQTVRKESIVDLTDGMAEDGTLSWDVPEGDWTIFRAGYVCNGRKNHPASAKGCGLEVDKLSASAMDWHFGHYIGKLCENLGPLAGNCESGFTGTLVDSYEAGSQNWTQGLDSIFRERAGYPVLPYLPVLAGRVVGSVDESERFLEDFRRVVADLFAENYAGRLAALCHERGLKLSLEPYGSCPADNLQYGRRADIPMGEFWSRAGRGAHFAETGNARFPAYVAHVWGRRIAGCESFTARPTDGGRWRTTPFSIKAQCDRAYAAGVNRIIYHRFVHQPWPGNNYLPGMTMGRWGMHFDRTQTWWPLAGEWTKYQARCQWMLQEGKFVADALFFCGEEAPNQGGNTDGAEGSGISLSPGRAWDVCGAEAMEALKVADGRVIVPGGVEYELLVLPASDTMGEKMLSVVERLLDAGAKVCAERRPVRAPGLGGDPARRDGAGYRALADRVWAKGVMECGAEEALERLGVAPDFISSENDPQTGAAYIHRRDAAADWYFVALNNTAGKRFEASFRIAGKTPEIWNAETGETADAPEWRAEGGRTVVTLDFPPSGSAFVVFRKPATAVRAVPRGRRAATSLPVSSVWRVTFPVDWYSGGSAEKTFEWTDLKDWTEEGDPDVKYFSGTATYATEAGMEGVECRPEEGDRLILDLGDVKEFAEVTVNGRAYPPLWRPPYRVDVTDALAASSGSGGEARAMPPLRISVRVTNLWPNRLIGDDVLCPDDCEWTGSVRNGVKEIGIKEIPGWVKEGKPSPAGRKTFTTWRHWTKDDKLLPSGLLGPAKIEIEKAAGRVAGGKSRRPCRGLKFSLPSAGRMMYSDPVNLARDGKSPYSKDPTVIRHGGRYLMYYSSTITVDGKWCLGRAAIAESTNLVDWTRVGDLKVDGWKSPWGWVAPCVKKFDGKVHLFGQTRQWAKSATDWKLSNLRHATSDDGVHFTLAEPWPEPVFVPRNAWCREQAIDAEVYRAGDRLMLMYVSRAKPGFGKNMLGMAWTPYGGGWGRNEWTELSVDAPSFKPEARWEMNCIEGPSVIERNGVYYMFYAGAFNHERQQIGLAWSADGVHFERWSDRPVLPHGPEGSWNAWESGHPGVFEDDDGQIYLFFQGKATQDGPYSLSCLKVDFDDGPAADGEGGCSFYGADAALSWIAREGAFKRPVKGGDTYRMVADLMKRAGFRHVREGDLSE